MSAMLTAFQQLRQQAAAELAQSARLRLGLVVIVAILWLWGLLVLGDQAQLWRESAGQLQEKAQALRPVLKERIWLERADDSTQQLQAVRAQLWSDPDLAVSEANLQDWLRGTAQKAGLTVRDLSVNRGALDKPTPALQGLTPVTARLVVDYNRLPMLGYLAEVARREPLVMVDRLALRLGAQPVLAELDVRILAATQAAEVSTAASAAQAASAPSTAPGAFSASAPALPPSTSASRPVKGDANTAKTAKVAQQDARGDRSVKPGAKP